MIIAGDPHTFELDLVQASSLVTSRRADLAVKFRLFRHFISGGDPDAERIYRWHIEARKAANAKVNLGMDSKSGTDQYVADAKALIRSMWSRGFDPAFAIPIDPDGELLGGAHRLGCALALGIEHVPVTRRVTKIFAPSWGEDWFHDNGASTDDLVRIRDVLRTMMGSNAS